MVELDDRGGARPGPRGRWLEIRGDLDTECRRRVGALQENISLAAAGIVITGLSQSQKMWRLKRISIDKSHGSRGITKW